MKTDKKRIKVRGNLSNVAKYLLTNEQKIFLIFDYEQNKKVGKRGTDDTETANQSKTIRPSSKSI